MNSVQKNKRGSRSSWPGRGVVILFGAIGSDSSQKYCLFLLRSRVEPLTVCVKNCKLDCRLNTAPLLCNYEHRSRRRLLQTATE